MSMTVEIRANGQLIGCVYIVNVLAVVGGECIYEYEFHTIGGERMTTKGKVKKGKVVHKRAEGWPKLLQLILKDTENKK